MNKGHNLSASEVLNLPAFSNAILSIIGCGGKTTFINQVARSCFEKKVLISPTTKIAITQVPNGNLLTTEEECVTHIPSIGIQCMGIGHSNSHKLTALPSALLEQLVADYDIVLLEADGSRGLSCKGWLPTEPVVPTYSTFTIGIVTLNGLGKPANDSYVLRLPEFLSLTHLQENDPITKTSLGEMICGKGGMFKNAVGERFLFINQIESDKEKKKSKNFAIFLENTYPSFFQSIVFGQANKNLWEEIHQ